MIIKLINIFRGVREVLIKPFVKYFVGIFAMKGCYDIGRIKAVEDGFTTSESIYLTKLQALYLKLINLPLFDHLYNLIHNIAYALKLPIVVVYISFMVLVVGTTILILYWIMRKLFTKEEETVAKLFKEKEDHDLMMVSRVEELKKKLSELKPASNLLKEKEKEIEKLKKEIEIASTKLQRQTREIIKLRNCLKEKSLKEKSKVVNKA